MNSGSARPMNPERGADRATGKGRRPGAGASDSPPASPAATTSIEVTPEQAWMLYDLVTRQKVAHDDAELEIRGPAGGERWRLLHRSLRRVVEQLPPEVAS